MVPSFLPSSPIRFERKFTEYSRNDMGMGPGALRDNMPQFQSADREFGTSRDAADEAPYGRIVYTTIGRLPSRVNRLCELERAVAQQSASKAKDDRVQGASVCLGWRGGGSPRERRFVNRASEHNDLHSHRANGVPENG